MMSYGREAEGDYMNLDACMDGNGWKGWEMAAGVLGEDGDVTELVKTMERTGEMVGKMGVVSVDSNSNSESWGSWWTKESGRE